MTAIEPGSDPHVVGMTSSWSLADKINYLFETIRRPDGKPYTNEDVAATISSRGDDNKIAGNYIWMLRRGKRANPTKRHLESLAEFFAVSPVYFFDDAESKAIVAELDLLRVLKDANIRNVAARLDGLSPSALVAIAQIVDSVRAAAGLPPGQDEKHVQS